MVARDLPHEAVAPLLAQRYAARVIQAHYRSAYAQRIAFRSSQQEAEERAAATKCQTVTRGRMARERMRRERAAKAFADEAARKTARRRAQLAIVDDVSDATVGKHVKAVEHSLALQRELVALQARRIRMGGGSG